MSARATRKPRTKPTTKPDRETIPLSALSITVPRPALFVAPGEQKPVTFEGKHLAAALRYVALVAPNLETFESPAGVGLELAGLAEECRAIGDANLNGIPIDTNAVFCSLGDRLRDLAARLNAREEFTCGEHTVTITRKPAGATS
ncbi:MAG: hypothetical protein ACREKH_19175 [Candidatus Rokuibacteriota bacterium]